MFNTKDELDRFTEKMQRQKYTCEMFSGYGVLSVTCTHPTLGSVTKGNFLGIDFEKRFKTITIGEKKEWYDGA